MAANISKMENSNHHPPTLNDTLRPYITADESLFFTLCIHTKPATHLDKHCAKKQTKTKLNKKQFYVYFHNLTPTVFSYSPINLFSIPGKNAECHMYEHQGKCCYLLSPRGGLHSQRLPTMDSCHTLAPGARLWNVQKVQTNLS